MVLEVEWHFHLGPIAQTFRDVVFMLVAVSGAIVAWLGLSAWKREHFGRQRYEVSKRMLLNVLRVRSSVDQVRAPLMQQHELTARPNRAEGERNQAQKDTAYAYQKRWELVSEPWSNFDAAYLEGKAIFLPDIDAERGEIVRSLAQLQWAIREQIRSLSDPEDSLKGAERGKVDGILYGWGGPDEDEEDKFKKSFQAEIEKMQVKLAKHLKP